MDWYSLSYFGQKTFIFGFARVFSNEIVYVHCGVLLTFVQNLGIVTRFVFIGNF
jgi:hypothetical protein